MIKLSALLLAAAFFVGCSHSFDPDSKVSLKGPKAEYWRRF